MFVDKRDFPPNISEVKPEKERVAPAPSWGASPTGGSTPPVPLFSWACMSG